MSNAKDATIETLRRLLATMVLQYGTDNRITLSRRQIEAVGAGELIAERQQDNSILLRVKGKIIGAH